MQHLLVACHMVSFAMVRIVIEKMQHSHRTNETQTLQQTIVGN